MYENTDQTPVWAEYKCMKIQTRPRYGQLGKSLYECRTGLAWRLIFVAQKGVLTFAFAGDHGEVQNYLRGQR
jgi:hypothetical protein